MVVADINADFAAALTAGGFMHIRTDFIESHVDQIALFEGGGLIECVSSLDGRAGYQASRYVLWLYPMCESPTHY